jgi:hypothetical protein
MDYQLHKQEKRHAFQSKENMHDTIVTSYWSASLTLLVMLTSAPLSRSKVTTSSWPFIAAIRSAVEPHWLKG